MTSYVVYSQIISGDNIIINPKYKNRYDSMCNKYDTYSGFTVATLFIKKEEI